jgi:hypothetical protein
VLGQARDFAYQGKLESLLVCEADPYLASLALRILCQDWGLCSNYTKILEDYINGVAWDHADELKLAALSAAGALLYEHEHLGLLRAAIDAYRSSSNEDAVREAAFRTMWLATKRDLRRLVPYGEINPPSSQEIAQAIHEAESLIQGVLP